MARKVKVPQVEHLYHFGEITDANASRVASQIEYIAGEGNTPCLWICSLGGDLGGALAIYDALQSVPGSQAVATGNCQSAALVAFLGAWRRWTTPNTIFMNHDVTAEGGVSLPDSVHLPALARLKKYPCATFDAKTAAALEIARFFHLSGRPGRP